MAEYIKRVNLSFDIRNAESKEAYEKIIKQPGNTKTLFVVNAVNNYCNANDSSIDIDAIKECLRQVINEYDFTIKNDLEQIKSEETIPDDIMDFLKNI